MYKAPPKFAKKCQKVPESNQNFKKRKKPYLRSNYFIFLLPLLSKNVPFIKLLQ